VSTDLDIGCIIQARMGSTRLPDKVMKKIDGNKTILESVISQVKHSKLIKKIVVATTTLPQDDVIVAKCQKLGVDVFRGSSNDVLDRYYQCAKEYSFSTIVRVTSDNPIIHPDVIDRVLKKILHNPYDFVTNCFPRTYSFGTEVEIFLFNAIEQAWKESTDPLDREHVTRYFYQNPDKFIIFNLENDKDLSHMRYTVDTIEDFEFVRNLFEKIKKRPILLEDMLDSQKQL